MTSSTQSVTQSVTQSASQSASQSAPGAVQAGYATLGELRMYYEIHGAGEPLVLLHGGFMNIAALGPLLPALAQSRQVIAVDMEGHGRTTHLERPLDYTQMADDVAALLGQLQLQQADVFGFSMGGMTALRLAMRHPNVVRRLVAVSSLYNNAGYPAALTAGWPEMSAAGMAGTPMEQSYLELAPHPERWGAFVEKMKEMMMSFEGWSAEDVASIRTPTLLVVGDADFIRLEHIVDLFRLLGGARDDGGLGGLPAAQLAVLPHTTHFDILERLDLLLPVVAAFLNDDGAAAEMAAGERQEQSDDA